MTAHRFYHFYLCAAALFLTTPARGEESRAPGEEARQNWPQWRGPFGTGVAPDAISNSDAPRLLARNQLDDTISASAAIAGGELYLRGERWLYCLSKSASDATSAPSVPLKAR